MKIMPKQPRPRTEKKGDIVAKTALKPQEEMVAQLLAWVGNMNMYDEILPLAREGYQARLSRMSSEDLAAEYKKNLKRFRGV